MSANPSPSASSITDWGKTQLPLARLFLAMDLRADSHHHGFFPEADGGEDGGMDGSACPCHWP